MGERTNPLANFIAGGVGGSLAVITGHPFDTIKVRVQTAPKPKPGEVAMFNGVLDCFKQTIAKEGFFALYKGMAAPLVGVSPLFAVFFLGCSIGKRLQQTETNEKLKFVQFIERIISRIHRTHQYALAGGLAGVFTTVIMVPGERIKCLLQVQSHATGPPKYSGPMDVTRQLWKEGGIRSIYKDIPASAAYLASYEYLMDAMAGPNADRTQLTPLKTLCAGGLAGIANWSVCLPQDVLKSRLQSAPEGRYSGIGDVARHLIREEGITALWKGFTPVMMRAFPANAACFMGLEFTLSMLHKAGLG